MSRLADLIHGRTGNYMEQANQVGELIGFWVAGLIPGYLFDRQRTLLVDLATAHEETLHALVSALDLREHNACMHSQRVRDYTLLLADRIGVSRQQRRTIGYGALLHDVGKIAVPDQILLKPAGLSDKGADIPLGARLFMVADVYYAVTSERPYRQPMSHHEAVNVIHDESGGHFDPAAVAAFEASCPEQWQSVSERFRA